MNSNNNTQPLFSIIVPCYNARQYIEQAIDSIALQSYEDFEVIAIDDGSTDDTADILVTLREKYGWLKTYHQENRGVSAARNFGISRASGIWILFLDADDLYEPEKLTRLTTLIEKHPTTHFFFHDCRFTGPEGQLRPNTLVHKGDSFENLIDFASLQNPAEGTYVIDAKAWQYIVSKRTWMQTNTVCIHNSLHAKLEGPFDESLAVGEDIDYYLRCITQLDHILYCDHSLARVRQHPNSATKSSKLQFRLNLANYFKSAINNWANQLDREYKLAFFKRVSENFLYISSYYRVRKEYRKAFLYALKGVSTSPSFSNFFILLKVFFPARSNVAD